MNPITVFRRWLRSLDPYPEIVAVQIAAAVAAAVVARIAVEMF